ncbi:hypothetical protein CEE39_05070 [bacterium (candidate division B38) B3_B38]|nr:MAG: hypothetical protein CEE39_05070 [bacterium (candidate division B38) B3_B38]
MLRAIRYFLREGWSSLWHNKGANLLSIAIIIVSLYVLGVFLVLSTNFNHIIERWSEDVQVNIFLDENLSEPALLYLQERLSILPEIGEFIYISKQEALQRFQILFPSLQTLPDEIGENPFPSSYELKIKKEYQTIDGVRGLASRLKSLDGVKEVSYDLQWIERLSTVMKLLRVIGIFLVGVLVFSAVSTTANVIKLLAYARKDEIDIMKLVGASSWFIKGPFLVEGMLQGFIAGIISIGLLYLSYRLVAYYLALSYNLLFGFLLFTFLPLEYWLGIIGGGTLVGLIGSSISIRKFLRY